PGTMAKYGVGPSDLTSINSSLIYAAATGFGQQGPHADYRAMDVTVQAMSGVVAITGYEDEPPLKSGPALCDILGGVHLYAAITTALVQRSITGHGAILDVSMQDSVIPTLCSALGAYYRFHDDPPRVGNHHQAKAVAPYNIYATKDGHVAIICIREGHWRKLLRAMNRLDLAEDQRFESMKNRAVNMSLTDEVVESWSTTLSTKEVFEICQANEVICAPVHSISDVLSDPHLIARGALQKLEHPELGSLMIPSTPLRFQGLEPPPVALPRAIGADNQAIYGELLGLSSEHVGELKQAGAI
ncbi:MAG: CoA transferase, partial [Gammaproteobacteria bacterium]|nr:CoA transferase [Gammaproteobacteria bacterium]